MYKNYRKQIFGKFFFSTEYNFFISCKYLKEKMYEICRNLTHVKFHKIKHLMI